VPDNTQIIDNLKNQLIGVLTGGNVVDGNTICCMEHVVLIAEEVWTERSN
jgi:hypothetical protein